jgi:UDP-N-acetylmuramoylalanine-D-glutamate ligase
MSLKNKHILLAGLDALHTGSETATWLLDQGARVTIVGSPARAVEQALQRTAHDGRDYEQKKARLTWSSKKVPADMVIAGPDDQTALFCSHWKKKIIGITGAHGKSTTAAWAAHLIGNTVLVGGTKSYFAALGDRAPIAIVEIASPDRFGDKRPTFTISTDADHQHDFDINSFAQRWGEHNVRNLLAAVSAARWAGVSEKTIQSRIASLPQMPLRQQVIHQDRTLTVVNDTMATLSARGSAAVQRWGGPNCILITGGIGQDADYREWADQVARHIRPTNTIFLAGSATAKMRSALGTHARGIRAYDSLERCWRVALDRAGKYISAVVLFSPAAKTDEVFAPLVKRDMK